MLQCMSPYIDTYEVTFNIDISLATVVLPQIYAERAASYKKLHELVLLGSLSSVQRVIFEFGSYRNHMKHVTAKLTLLVTQSKGIVDNS